MTGERPKLVKHLPLMLIALLFAALMLLTAILIGMLSGDLERSVDLPRSGGSTGALSEAGLAETRMSVLPEFIGVSLPDSRRCIIGNSNTAYAFYSGLCGYLSDYLSSDRTEEVTAEKWVSYALADNSVFLRFHCELPGAAVGSLAGLVSERSESREPAGGLIYEMILIPSTENSEMSKLAVRSLDGKCTEYILDEQSEKLTPEAVSRISGAYSFLDQTFIFACEKSGYSYLSPTEPVILDPVVTRNIIITDSTAQFLMQKTADVTKLIQVFSMNPDKLLSSRSDQSVQMASDRSGVLRIYPSSIEFQAADDAANDISSFVGNVEKIGISEYVRAVYSIISSIKNMGTMYTGGECDIRLAGISSSGEQTELVFDYYIDNLRITGIGHAVTAVFSRAKLVSFKLHTISAKGLGAFSESFSEWWFDDVTLRNFRNVRSVSLVYRGSFVKESLSAEWAALAE